MEKLLRQRVLRYKSLDKIFWGDYAINKEEIEEALFEKEYTIENSIVYSKVVSNLDLQEIIEIAKNSESLKVYIDKISKKQWSSYKDKNKQYKILLLKNILNGTNEIYEIESPWSRVLEGKVTYY